MITLLILTILSSIFAGLLSAITGIINNPGGKLIFVAIDIIVLLVILKIKNNLKK